MRPWLWVSVLGIAAAPVTRAGEPPSADKNDTCLSLNNRILGPRSGDRPLPLLSGDPAHGFHPACAVPWSTLSPRNQPLPVVGCFKGSLLQVENEAACGAGTGPLWVSSRWVVTSAELQNGARQVVVCQQLETGAWAGTRDFKLECAARRGALKAPEPKPAGSPPDAAAPAATAPGPAAPGTAPADHPPPPHPES